MSYLDFYLFKEDVTFKIKQNNNSKNLFLDVILISREGEKFANFIS